MSKRSTGGRSGDEWPPEWVEAGARQGVDPVVWATTSGGAIYLAVWHAFRDATEFEQDWASAPAPGKDCPMPVDGVARVRALREARRERLDFSADDWQGLVRLVRPTLSEHERQNPQEILTALAAIRPHHAPLARRGPGRPPWTEPLFLEHWREAESMAAPRTKLRDVAPHFRNLDGKLGVDQDYLRRLRRRFTRPTEIPE